jgi:hypothetical protein
LLGEAFDDLTAQCSLGFVVTGLTGEEPRVGFAAEARPEHGEVECEHLAHGLR